MNAGTINFSGTVVVSESFTPSSGSATLEADLNNIFANTQANGVVTGGELADNGGAVETVATVSPYIEVGASTTLATVTTTAVSDVTTTTATLGGNVTDDGGYTVIERGVVYNTIGTPNVDDDTKVQIGSGDGSFTQEITGVIAKERVLPLPVMIMSALATTLVFEEAVVTTKVLSPGKVSLIVKASPETEPLIHSDWFAMAEAEGVSLDVVVNETSLP